MRLDTAGETKCLFSPIFSLTAANSRCLEAQGQTMPFQRTTEKSGKDGTSGGHAVQPPVQDRLPLVIPANNLTLSVQEFPELEAMPLHFLHYLLATSP